MKICIVWRILASKYLQIKNKRDSLFTFFESSGWSCTKGKRW